jgi:Leishmanolysin
VGGADPFMDYCPVYAGFSNGLCSDSENEALIKVNYIEKFGQRNSRCLSSNMVQSFANYSDTLENSTSSTFYEVAALCLPIACVVEDRSLRIQINGVWRVCSSKDEVLTISEPPSFLPQTRSAGIVASVICPDPIRVCPTFFCHRDCLGTSRACDYSIGKCVCLGSLLRNTSNSVYATITGKSFANINDTNDGICMPSNSNESFDPNSSESFYEPEEDGDRTGLPTSDSPLSDYYYKSERNLKQESSRNFWSRKWKVGFSGSGTFVFLALISSIIYYMYGRNPHRELRIESFDDDDDDESTNEVTANPNKDKLMASVVVNLRINETRRDETFSNRDSETELSMTDTDGVSDTFGSLDLSIELPSTVFEYGGTIVDLAAYDNAGLNTSSEHGGLYDDERNVCIDPLAPPSAQANVQVPIVRRRRHLFSRI